MCGADFKLIAIVVCLTGSESPAAGPGLPAPSRLALPSQLEVAANVASGSHGSTAARVTGTVPSQSKLDADRIPRFRPTEAATGTGSRGVFGGTGGGSASAIAAAAGRSLPVPEANHASGGLFGSAESALDSPADDGTGSSTETECDTDLEPVAGASGTDSDSESEDPDYERRREHGVQQVESGSVWRSRKRSKGSDE